MDRSEWIAACAHQLQRRWRTVDPEMLEDVAGDLWADDALRILPPIRAAVEWLRPIEEPEPPRANGILAKISGADIARGSHALPPPASGQPKQVQTEIAVGHIGRVRITYTLSEARHRGKSSHHFWCASYAERIE